MQEHKKNIAQKRLEPRAFWITSQEKALKLLFEYQGARAS